MVKFNF